MSHNVSPFVDIRAVVDKPVVGEDIRLIVLPDMVPTAVVGKRGVAVAEGTPDVAVVAVDIQVVVVVVDILAVVNKPD